MKKPNSSAEILRALSMLSQLGISMAVCMFIGVIGGKYLDKWFGTSPIWLILGSVIGGAASFKVLYDIAIKRWSDK